MADASSSMKVITEEHSVAVTQTKNDHKHCFIILKVKRFILYEMVNPG